MVSVNLAEDPRSLSVPGGSHTRIGTALRLALGQDRKSPLFILGRLGETHVRVTRKGNDIQVKLGDTFHEIIRTGAPYGVDDNGCLVREEAAECR